MLILPHRSHCTNRNYFDLYWIKIHCTDWCDMWTLYK